MHDSQEFDNGFRSRSSDGAPENWTERVRTPLAGTLQEVDPNAPEPGS